MSPTQTTGKVPDLQMKLMIKPAKRNQSYYLLLKIPAKIAIGALGRKFNLKKREEDFK
jgi:hypothetical protein